MILTAGECRTVITFLASNLDLTDVEIIIKWQYFNYQLLYNAVHNSFKKASHYRTWIWLSYEGRVDEYKILVLFKGPYILTLICISTMIGKCRDRRCSFSARFTLLPHGHCLDGQIYQLLPVGYQPFLISTNFSPHVMCPRWLQEISIPRVSWGYLMDLDQES